MSESAGARTISVQGHRGARGLLPENTLAGFQHAVDLGARSLELDIGLTRDGHAVVHHDVGLNPETTRDESGCWIDEPVPVHALSLAALKRLDVGRIRPHSEYATRFPEQQAIDGSRIPSLAEVFEWVRSAGHDWLRINIEVKCRPDGGEEMPSPTAFAEAVVATIDAHRMHERVWVESFDWRVQREVQRMHSGIDTAFLTVRQPFLNTLSAPTGKRSPWLAGFELRAHEGSVPRMVHAAGGKVWCPHFRDLTVHAVDEAHALGLSVFSWTVNERHELLTAIDHSVDALITDYPDRARAALAERGHLLADPMAN